ncbi:DUF29 domain-containing protein [Gloeocapsopsis sp. IPPAS B-1203]|uniref:DUF29 domain-containing protein n=1 Tax=Gloeocapsopsis sp. IPPAS B-1203 TaxID=2049454 RepID=UPI0025A132DC|nr:DUF29 domain-containing protein [Gloeocapsopsis sp. IPPAS B-1203]
MNTLYDRDFYQWIETTVNQLRQQKFDLVDWENLIEELEGLGRSEKRAVRSHLVILLLHLLKWQYQPEYQSRSWRTSVNNARRQLMKLLKDNPSLAGDFLLESVPDAYEEAKETASEETTIFLENFPDACPYTVEQLLAKDWLPRS